MPLTPCPDSPPSYDALTVSYRFYLVSRTLSVMANQMVLVALGWQIYDLTGSAWDLGLVGLAQFIPALLLALPGGHLLDNYDKKKLLALSMLLQAVAAIFLCWGSAAGWIGRDLILLLCLLIGAARALQLPTQQAMVPSLVPAPTITRALAVNAMLNKISTIGGPALGGFLYLAGAGVVYGICALMFILATAFAVIIRSEPVRVKNKINLVNLCAGVLFIGRNKVVLAAVLVDLCVTVLGSVMALLPIFAKDILHAGPLGLGLLRSASAIGGLLVSIWMAKVFAYQDIGRKMFIAIGVLGISTLLFSLSQHLWASLVLLLVIGGADMFSTVIRHSIVQIATPHALLGRVSAVHSTSISASNELGQFRAGAVAEYLGPAETVLLGAVSILVAIPLLVKRFPELARKQQF